MHTSKDTYRLHRVFLGLLGMSVFLLGLPLFRVLRKSEEPIDWWFLTLQVVIPVLFLAFGAFRYERWNAARLVEIVSLPYVVFMAWLIGACILGRDPNDRGILIASAIVVAALLAYLLFVDELFAGPGERERWWQTLRARNICRGVSLALAGALCVTSLSTRDLRPALTLDSHFITANEGVGSPAAWTQAIETALGFAFSVGAVLLFATGLFCVAGKRLRKLASAAAAIAAALAFMAVADYYFGWLYAYALGALSDWNPNHNWHSAWRAAGTALWLASIVAVPLLAFMVVRRDAETRRTAARLALLIYSPLMLFDMVMLPLLSESLEARGESEILLALQLLAWYFASRTAEERTTAHENVADEQYEMIGV